MIKNYLKIAFRNFWKNKVQSLINMAGLSVGMGVAILVGLWVWDELSFNKYHQNYDRIAQVMARQESDGVKGINNAMSWPMAMELKTNYQKSFNHVVLSSWMSSYILSAGEKKISGTGIFMGDGAPDMLTLKMVSGSRAGLKDPHSILLAASIARALFGNTEPVNQVVRLNNKINVTVTGVYEDLPLNGQFNQNKFFAPFDLWVSENDWIQKSAAHDWANHFLRIYVEIPQGANFDKLSNTIKDIERRHEAEFKKGGFGNPVDFLQPMSKWHLYPFNRGKVDGGPVRMVWLVGMIGLIVLLLACINFMNLSTARSEKRAKEVGIRKTIGSARWQLAGQFFSESFLVVFFAFMLAILLVVCSLSWFNDLSAKQMIMPWNNPYFWMMSLAFIFITGTLAGSYPALYLSSFKPVKVLKSSFRAGRFSAVPRKILVVLQFSVSVILIISTVVIYRQIEYAKDRPVGYDKKGLLMMEMKSPDFYGKYELLRAELKNTGVVEEMSESMGSVTNVWSNNNGFTWKGKDPGMKESFGTLVVTGEHGKTVGWQFVQGRDFSRELTSDSSGVVMNEAAAKYMGLENPVGETIRWKFWLTDSSSNYTVLGVVKDMVMESPYEPIRPTLFFIKSLNGGVSWINIRLDPHISASRALPKIEAVFKRLIPSAPFEYKFTDEEYDRKFAAEERIGKLATFFGSLAIFISCLGLFGMALFMAEQRTKEIGVRKVLGASVFSLWKLLSGDFLQLVLISLLIATPAAIYFMHSWLQSYSYRTELSWWIFGVTGVGAMLITLLTVSYQSIKAALTNPVKSLRTE